MDSSYVIDSGVHGSGNPFAVGHNWPSTRLRRGLVMGSVQSGKTASLLAVAAKGLDAGVNIVVILAGTRLALWRQTLNRTSAQLDGWRDDLDVSRRSERIFLPSPKVFSSFERESNLEELYFETPNLVRRMLIEGKPLVAVVMKNADHLMSFGRFLHRVISGVRERSSTPLHLLVIDDEADDGSILDRDVESGLAPDSELLKQIPRHIARLWAGSAAPHETLHERLFATYLAYTATPQSNFLQSTHNPLSPTDFIAALRVPGRSGSVPPPRSTTYVEPKGVTNYYIGGELFYQDLSHGLGGLCVTRQFPVREKFSTVDDFQRQVEDRRWAMLGDALRAYFVAGAIRLLVQRRRLSEARQLRSTSRQSVLDVCPAPHTMLFHPSAKIDEHFRAAREVSRWCTEFDASERLGDDGATHVDPVLELSRTGLVARLNVEEELWKSWVDSYENTAHRLSFLPGGGEYQVVTRAQWPAIRELLVSEVFVHTRIAVINSDFRADDRPQFDPTPVGEDQYTAPRDIYTIFVSGNVMARGITLDGLATTLFLRSADEPLADTQMQMQRWFGYRGAYLCWCRVFAFVDQLELFRGYHESDEALKREILEEMNSNPGMAPRPLVLESNQFRATGKIANLRALPLCPGPDPFVRIEERGVFANANAGLLSNLLEHERWSNLDVGGITRGLIMSRKVGFIEVAELLEAFQFASHNPDPTSEQHRRWRSIASELGLRPPVGPLFRPPSSSTIGTDAVVPRYCPYSIAAYLRLWQALLTRRARGMYPTDDARTPWSLIDLAAYARTAPTFYIAIRFGEAGVSNLESLAKFNVHRMHRESRDGVFISTWGSRNPGEDQHAYLGDQLFDYHVHKSPLPIRRVGEPTWRQRGSPGLVLFHVIGGLTNANDAVTVGLAIPSGGPDHIAALRVRPSRTNAS